VSWRVGVDLVLLSRAEHLLKPENRSVLCRMLRPHEVSTVTRGGSLDPNTLAGFLAAKEAVFKLFHEPHRPVPWQFISVESREGTWPEIYLEGTAAALAESAGIDSEISVSISHEGDYAVAIAAATTK
jgi:holo-[acyl-carrier protein] synthase